MVATAIHTGVWLALLVEVDPNPQPIGFVLEVIGAWETSGDAPRPIRDGDRLLPGTKIRPAASVARAPTDSITVCHYNGQTKVYRDAVTLPDQRDPSLLNRLWTAALGHYRHGYASAISRGQYELIDGVLGLNDETVDLAPLFADVVDGSYRVELRWAERKASFNDEAIDWTFVKQPAKSISVEWNLKQPPRVIAGGLKQGLYEATLIESRNPGGENSVGTPAWILICNSKEAAGTAKDYAEAVQLTESWDANREDKVSPSAKRAFLRAYLISRREAQKP
jgi:hypothetical protein